MQKHIQTINFLRKFSVPLITGVVLALVWANLDFQHYKAFLFSPLIDNFTILGHDITFHFLVNDIFMVFFFGIAAVEITEAVMLKSGSLNPISKAINPLLGTIGGVVGPVAVFFILCYVMPLGSLMTGDITM